MSIICGVIGLVIPFLVPKGPNRGIIQVMLVTTAVCFYVFWFCCILAQMNPLFGPELNKEAMYIVAQQWNS
ncbi:ATP6V0E1 [Bugula neritina]|uniref:ATP6V0E1 n=1 Tax=Bugula neritina TaxID=10212 RepID=A0A7J7KC08_BUGNE|nr:ATP6V0E1 [Bugula neritina]